MKKLHLVSGIIVLQSARDCSGAIVAATKLGALDGYTRFHSAYSSLFCLPMQRFEGSDTYVATDDLKLAVNAALILQRPLLIKGEPGTGKTMLAEEVARALGMPLLAWHIKSTTKGAARPVRVRRRIAAARLAAR